jgi:hypothetical protein
MTEYLCDYLGGISPVFEPSTREMIGQDFQQGLKSDA